MSQQVADALTAQFHDLISFNGGLGGWVLVMGGVVVTLFYAARQSRGD